MPGYTRDKKRDQLVYVPLNSTLYYGFKTKDLSSIAGITASDLTNQLGHVDAATAAGLTGKILILGANAPKPPRVTKKIANAAPGTQQTVGTFCARGKLATAMSAGWNVSDRGGNVTLRAPNASSGSQTAIAELSDGTLYCFPLNKEDFTSYGASLGLKSASDITTQTERDKLVAGTSKPRPGRAKIVLGSGSTFQSFFSTSAADDLPGAGFDILEEEIILSVAPPAP